jgi:[acyl-carrier-protein] S-malonyltransferase
MNSQGIALIFPGQGSQVVGMGKSLAAEYFAARRVYEEGDDLLEINLSKLAWEGPEDLLNDTINTQPALLIHSVAVLQVLKEQDIELIPTFVAGHSMGEFSALVASGALPFDQALLLVRKRGEVMKKAGEINPGGMAAIIGLDIPDVESICEDASEANDIVQIANDNCPGQVVISGTFPAMERAMSLALQAGAKRAIPLAVSIAAHSPLMDLAQDAFNQEVEHTNFSQVEIPIIGNVTAEPLFTQSEISADLRAQLTSRVRWTESMQYMLQNNVKTFIEIGSGKVLTGLLRRIDRKVLGVNLEKPEDIDYLPGLIA